MAEKKHVFIVASPRARTGKTTLARLIAEYLTLTGETRKLFDTDVIDHKLASYFPTQAHIVDLERVPDQMKLFDSLTAGEPTSQVIDVSHRSFAKFFTLMRDIEYVAEARQAGRYPVILFIPDAAAETYDQGLAILEGFRDAGFVLVRNLALGELPQEKLQEGSVDILQSHKPHIIMPRLDPFTLSAVEDPRLSLSDFMRRTSTPDALGPIPPVQMSIAYLSLEARKATLYWLKTMFDEIRRATRDVDLQAYIVAHDRFGA